MMQTLSWTNRCCPHLALRRLLALSSQCSDIVSCSWSRAMAFSTDGWGANPTPWSMSLLMVSRVRVAGWALACCTPSSHRACSSLTLRRGSSGRSTSKSKLTSKRLWISATLGSSSARTFSLCCWKSSMRFKSSWRWKIQEVEKCLQIRSSSAFYLFNRESTC